VSDRGDDATSSSDRRRESFTTPTVAEVEVDDPQEKIRS
jgi:hypothetical protein